MGRGAAGHGFASRHSMSVLLAISDMRVKREGPQGPLTNQRAVRAPLTNQNEVPLLRLHRSLISFNTRALNVGAVSGCASVPLLGAPCPPREDAQRTRTGTLSFKSCVFSYLSPYSHSNYNDIGEFLIHYKEFTKLTRPILLAACKTLRRKQNKKSIFFSSKQSEIARC